MGDCGVMLLMDIFLVFCDYTFGRAIPLLFQMVV